jgi:threonine dehydratase
VNDKINSHHIKMSKPIIKNMNLPSLETLIKASAIVYRTMERSPCIPWPRLSSRLGAHVWMKHENCTPIGSYKLRGGLNFVSHNRAAKGFITATRGNHGQSIAFAAKEFGIPCTIVVPHENSLSKNVAMKALGAHLIVEGNDFQSSVEYASLLSQEGGPLRIIPP